MQNNLYGSVLKSNKVIRKIIGDNADTNENKDETFKFFKRFDLIENFKSVKD